MKTKILFFLLLSPSLFWAQSEIQLKNPSFEAVPQQGRLNATRLITNEWGGKTNDWIYCGPTSETMPDIHPSPHPERPFFEVDKLPIRGKTYLGMVVRENDTQESLGQKLQKPLQEGQTYQLSVFLAKSSKYASNTLVPGIMVDHNKAVVLNIWGGDDLCDKGELLVQTNRINHSDWREYTFTFQASEDWNYILLEAMYHPNAKLPYAGNILIDGLSSIVEVNQEEALSSPSIEVTNAVQRESTFRQEIKEEKIVVKKERPVDTDKILGLFENRRSYAELKNKELPSQINFAYTTWKFKEEVGRSGLRLYLMNFKDQESIQTNIDHLKTLGMEKTASILNKTSGLYFRHLKGENLSEEEYEYFEDSDQLFKTALREESIKQQLRNYIEENLTHFQEEYSALNNSEAKPSEY